MPTSPKALTAYTEFSEARFALLERLGRATSMLDNGRAEKALQPLRKILIGFSGLMKQAPRPIDERALVWEMCLTFERIGRASLAAGRHEEAACAVSTGLHHVRRLRAFIETQSSHKKLHDLTARFERLRWEAGRGVTFVSLAGMEWPYGD